MGCSCCRAGIVVGLSVARDSRASFARYPLRQNYLVPLVTDCCVVGAASVLFLSRCPSAPGANRRNRVQFSRRSATVSVHQSDIAINDPSRSSIPPWRTVTRCTGDARRQREGGKRRLIRRQGTNSWSRRPTTRRKRDAPE